MSSVTFLVPTSAVAALIGHKGTRVKDIQSTTGAQITFSKALTDGTTTAHIRGSSEQIQKTIMLLKISVLHLKAANNTPPPAPDAVTMQTRVSFDMAMFTHEMYKSSVSHQSPQGEKLIRKNVGNV